MRTIVLVCALLVAFAAAQPIGTDVLPITDPRCASDAWVKWDKTSNYVAGFTGVTKLCTRRYVDVCLAPQGLQPCNQYYGVCREVGYDYSDKALYPNMGPTVKPTVCVSAGAYMTPDVKVLVIAEVMFGFFLFIIAFVLVLGIGRAVRGYSMAVVVTQLVMSLTLMFSYYYLNGVIQLAASIAALALFRTRKPILVGVGILFLLAAFFWVTYRFGLGGMQHQSRFQAGVAAQNTYEQYCLNYYRGYFAYIQDLHDVGENPEEGAWGYCTRNWLSASMFFQIFGELLLVLLAATGIQSLLMEDPEVKTVSETEPAQ
jgi:hypothetical protein